MSEVEPMATGGESTGASQESIETSTDAVRAEPAGEPGETGEQTSGDGPEPELVLAEADGEPVAMPDDMAAEDLLGADTEDASPSVPSEDLQLRAVLEAIVYVADEPLPLAQLAASLQQPKEKIEELMGQLMAEFERPEHGLALREVAGGYKLTTKPEHHEAVRAFVRSLKPPLKLSLAALETLAVVAYKQPITGPEIMEIRGVQGAGVLKTLLDRKLIAVAGRKNVIGKPMLYKTTKEFLVQFGLKDLSELPSLKEFEELRRMAFSDEPGPEPVEPPSASPAADSPEPPETAAAPEPEAAQAETAAVEEPQPQPEPTLPKA